MDSQSEYATIENGKGMLREMNVNRAGKAVPVFGGLRRIALAVVFWTTVGAIFALSRLENGESFRGVLLPSMMHWWTWGLLTPLIVGVDRRLPSSGRQFKRIAIMLLLGPAWTLLFVCSYTTLSVFVRSQRWPVVFGNTMQGLFWHMLIYLMIVGVSEAYMYRRQYEAAELQRARLESSFSEARLHALRIQLDPHFLFNALNTISSEVGGDPKLARRMIEHLGDLLRLSLESRGRQEVTLAEELSFLEHYLAIQKIRFGDKLKISVLVPPEVRHATVPSLFIQPLVENAIRHGISMRARGGSVSITAECCENRLFLRIQDDGVGLPAGWPSGDQTGLGLAITRERLAGLHPDGSASLAVTRRPEGGTQVELSFPFRSFVDGVPS